MEQNYWRRCTSCKSEIGFQQKYWICSVSTCNRKRTGMVFCKVSCWDAHVPVMNHKESWAEENTAPSKQQNTESAVTKVPRSSMPSSSSTEVLVVASKVKAYIKRMWGMNTSASTMDALTEEVKKLANRAIEFAKLDDRKTLMDRDFK